MFDLKLENGQVYMDGTYVDTNIYIRNGIIERISEKEFEVKDTYDCKGNIVFPGIIDPHTHFDLDLGHIKSADDFHSGSIAAAYGGVTTFIDFLEPVNSKQGLIEAFDKRKKEAINSVIDYKFHATIKNPVNKIDEIVEGIKELGIHSVKLFTTYSDSNRRTYDEEIYRLLQKSNTENFLVLAHIENDEMIVLSEEFKVSDLPKSRPSLSETTEALKLADFVRETQGNLYMVHLSSGFTLDYLQHEYKDILNTKFFVESCPHYFSLSSKSYGDDDGFLYTLAPPLRRKMEVDTLRNLIDDVHTIGTDHCPFMSNEKSKESLNDIPLGISGVEYSFAVLFTMFREKIIDKMTVNVAKTHNIYPQKGVILEGSDADFFIYEQGDFTIKENHSNCDYNLYEGFNTAGRVISTISRGEFVIKDRELMEHTGQFLPGGR